MSAVARRMINDTIVLDSSNETDVIECSLQEEEEVDKNKFFKTPRSNFKRRCSARLKNEVLSLKAFQFTNEKNQGKSPTNCKPSTPKSSVPQTCRVAGSGEEAPEINGNCPLPAVEEPSKDKVTPYVNRFLSRVKGTPHLPLLSQSKILSIEKWLAENDFNSGTASPKPETWRTPTSARKKTAATTKTATTATPKRRLRNSENQSSPDSVVKGLLEAVYGEEWDDIRVPKRCKTEPRNSRKKVTLSTKTDFKVNAKDGAVKGKTTTRNARRNIMKDVGAGPGVGTVNLDDSFASGVKRLNSSASDEDLNAGDSLSVRRTRRRTYLSADSLSPELRSSKKKKRRRRSGGSKEGEGQEEGKRVTRAQSGSSSKKTKTPVRTFLASLSVSTPKSRCHPEAQDYKVHFKTKKEELVKRLFKLYNGDVFGNQLPDDMDFSWNVKLRGTAGYCYNRKITKSTGHVTRRARIELSTKIVDRADRLRDTLIHELCHAAAWVIDGVLDGHGNVWTKWSNKAMARFPELPPIRRCHNYEVVSKYTYRCSGCGYSINRHSKSINIERKRCGYCFGVLELFVNKKKRGKGEVPEFETTRTLPAPKSFALFVKENYHNVKESAGNAKHAEIMKILGRQYALTKKAANEQQDDDS